MTPADQHALREALADVIQEWAGLKGDWRPWPGQAADDLIAGPLAPYLAAEAENTRLKETVEAMRATLKLAENPLSYRNATDPNGPGSHAVARALDAVRSVLATIPPKEGL